MVGLAQQLHGDRTKLLGMLADVGQKSMFLAFSPVTTPRRRLGFFLHLTYSDSQIAQLIKLDGLQTRISNW
jgi:hypothetical protein